MKNQKTYIFILSLLIALSQIGCSADTPEPDTSDPTPVERTNSQTVITNVKERGLCFSIEQEYLDKGVTLESSGENAKGYKNIGIFYYSPTSIALLNEINTMDYAKLTEALAAEYIDKLLSSSRCLMEVVMIETSQYDSLCANGAKPEDFTSFTPAQILGTNDGCTYILSIPELDNGTLNESETADYHACKEYMQTVRDNLTFIPIEDDNKMPSFTAKDINGNDVDSTIFSEKKLTIVNVWGTFCGPCIEEMPELAAWAEEMGDDMQIIGIVGDINGENDTQHIELAQTITQRANASYIHLIPNADFDSFMANIVGFPTTFFVDQTGAFINEPIVGANVNRCKEVAAAYLSEH